jgi:hypothetical protein
MQPSQNMNSYGDNDGHIGASNQDATYNHVKTLYYWEKNVVPTAMSIPKTPRKLTC